jgi:hypothetical protein
MREIVLPGDSAEGEAGLDAVKAMYRRVLSGWASDLLRQRPAASWPARDPQADFRDRDWRGLYRGSVLDD